MRVPTIQPENITMRFDLSKTPTLHAVTHADEQALAENLHQRVVEGVAQAEATPEAVEAEQVRAAAQQNLENTRRAERTLSALARTLNDQMSAATDEAISTFIETAAAGVKPDLKKLSAIAALETQGRLVTRAIERLVEHLIPLAEIGHLRADSHAKLAGSRALEVIAQQRAEKLLGQLRHAVAEEVVLPVDLSKGVAGALLARAADLRRRAIEASTNADRLEESYRETHQKR